MSGARRNVLADVTKDGGYTEEELKRAMSPEAIRRETGRSDEEVREGAVGRKAPRPISPQDPNRR